MKNVSLAVSALLLAVSVVAQSPSSPPPLPRVRIILVGDSTVAVRTGWGPGFCADVVAEVACVNMAKGGRSTSSYRAEGSWAAVMDELKHNSEFKMTYVLIQFGHNDQPGKPGRSTDLVTEFPVNLQHYAEDVKSTGAKPVLITSLTRRLFTDGKLTNDLAPWAESTKKVAAEQGVPVLDLNSDSVAAVQKMGHNEADTLAAAPPPPVVAENVAASPVAVQTPLPVATAAASAASVPANNAAERPVPAPPKFDYTHLGEKGASFFGRIVADELVKAVPELQPYIKP